MSRDPIPRWVYRVRSLKRARDRLAEAVALAKQRELSDLEIEGLAQRFEYTLELSWKALKDYLEAQGTILPEITPRRVLRAAQAAKILSNGQVWMDAVAARNLLSHRYDEAAFRGAVREICERYLPAIDALTGWLDTRAGDRPDV